MRICYFGNAASVHLVRWAKCFQARGDEVHVITLHRPTYDLSGVTVHYVTSKLSRYRDAAFLANRNRIRALLNRIRPDILHAHFIVNYGFYAATLGLRPLVSSAWGSDVLVCPQQSLRLRLMARYAAEKADLVLSESQAATQALIHVLATPAEKIRTFPWGIDVDFFLAEDPPARMEELRRRLGVESGQTIIVSPRSAAPVYNIPVIMRAIPAVVREHSKAVFVVVRGFGDVRYEEAMKTLAAELGIGEHVRFVSSVLTPEEMRLLYKTADIMISVPRSDSASVALLEGIVLGAVPVVSDLETNRVVIRDGVNGYVVPVGDSVMLAQRVSHAIRHLNECKPRMASLNLALVRDTRSVKISVDQMAAIYQELTQAAGCRTAMA